MSLQFSNSVPSGSSIKLYEQTNEISSYSVADSLMAFTATPSQVGQTLMIRVVIDNLLPSTNISSIVVKERGYDYFDFVNSSYR